MDEDVEDEPGPSTALTKSSSFHHNTSSAKQQRQQQTSKPATREESASVKMPRKVVNFTAMTSQKAAEISHRKLGHTILTPELKRPDPGQQQYMKVTNMQG